MAIIGYTSGVFDLFHIGHLNVLRRAKLDCDHLIVGVTTDELSLAAKGKTPIIPFEERMDIVGNIRCVDEVVPQADMNKMNAWRRLKFDRMMVGDDWKGTEMWNSLEAEFTKLGVEILYYGYTQHTSSSKLRQVIDAMAE